jgi:hypothetical protein
MSKTRTYSELSRFVTFDERFEYLKLVGEVGKATFGYDRWVNQLFYRSREWKRLRDFVIYRDEGCDLGVPGYELRSGLLIHHMDPVTVEDIQHGSEAILDPNFLITTSLRTHNAIHYGDSNGLPRRHVDRKTGDTTLW